jgi:hypothetical protein
VFRPPSAFAVNQEFHTHLSGGRDKQQSQLGVATMNFGLEIRLHQLKQQHGDRLLTLLTIMLVLLMFVLVPLSSVGFIFQALAGVVELALIVVALIVSGSTTAFILLLVAFFMAFAVFISRASHDLSIIHLYLTASSRLIVAVTLSWIVGHVVFGPGRVSYHRIVGAIFLYLLIAVAFSSLFTFVGLLIPNAISGIKFKDSSALLSQLLYFNFVTLTSVGYGDIVPVHPIARSLSNLETILGQFYPATLLARLVTLEVAGRTHDG